jgi:hypothetical protein
MGKGKKMAGGSFMSKHAKNLLNYMPIDDRAGSGSDSDLNYNGSPLHDKGHGGAEGHTHSTMSNVKNYIQNSSFNNFRIKGGGDLQSQRRPANTKPFGESRQQKFNREETRKKNLARKAEINALKKG